MSCILKGLRLVLLSFILSRIKYWFSILFRAKGRQFANIVLKFPCLGSSPEPTSNSITTKIFYSYYTSGKYDKDHSVDMDQ